MAHFDTTTLTLIQGVRSDRPQSKAPLATTLNTLVISPRHHLASKKRGRLCAIRAAATVRSRRALRRS